MAPEFRDMPWLLLEATDTATLSYRATSNSPKEAIQASTVGFFMESRPTMYNYMKTFSEYIFNSISKIRVSQSPKGKKISLLITQ